MLYSYAKPSRGGKHTTTDTIDWISNMTRTVDETTETDVATTGLSEGQRARMLAAERRRTALAVLAGRTGPVDLEDLAAEIAARERERTGSDGDSPGRVATTLHHVHLPQIADLGIIDYDPDANRVESCPPLDDG